MRAFELEQSNPEVYQFLRRHIGHFLFPVALLALLLSGVSNNIALIIAGQTIFLTCGLGAIAVMVIAKWRGSEVKIEYPGGSILSFDFDPHPVNSMVKSLRKHVPISSIDTLKMMSSDIERSNDYYQTGHKKEKSFFQILREECPEARVVVYGPSEAPFPPKSIHPQIEYIQTSGPLTKHVNLIITKDGSSFVWHEPYHFIKGREHIFTGGAYLIAIDERLREKVEEQFEKLASKRLPTSADN